MEWECTYMQWQPGFESVSDLLEGAFMGFGCDDTLR